MSETLSQREIEDVLTSIRRLVSQEAERGTADRLLLTTALRVVGDDTAPTPVVVAPQPAIPEPAGAAAAIVAASAGAASGDDMLLDESTLRDMVAQMLRDELRGAMGEQLTRSIRKLVRAEVARALSEREFL